MVMKNNNIIFFDSIEMWDKRNIKDINYYVNYKKTHYNLSEQDVTRVYEVSNIHYNSDSLWVVINDLRKAAIIKRDWDKVNSYTYYISVLLFHSNEYFLAFKYLLDSIIIDLSGIHKSHIDEIQDVNVPSGKVNDLEQLYTILKFNYEQVRILINSSYIYRILPFNYFDKNTLYEIIIDFINGFRFKYKKYDIYVKPKEIHIKDKIKIPKYKRRFFKKVYK